MGQDSAARSRELRKMRIGANTGLHTDQLCNNPAQKEQAQYELRAVLEICFEVVIHKMLWGIKVRKLGGSKGFRSFKGFRGFKGSRFNV